MKIWPYDPDRILENKAGYEPITDKQITYISRISVPLHDSDEKLKTIMDSISSDLSVKDLSKGQAMYVIKCLLGEIKQVNITPEIRRRILETSIVENGGVENEKN